MIAYLTFAEQPSGIYSGQVIDTCAYLSTLSEKKIRLIAFISLRDFFATRKKIKQQYACAVVVPMFPKLKNWRINSLVLLLICLRYNIHAVICRSALATRLALMVKKVKLLKKVVYDGRGAEYEQMKEYKMIPDEKLILEMLESEKIAALDSDFQMAVTSSMINYWKEKFNYQKNSHVIIPCTLNSKHSTAYNPEITRAALGFSEQDIVLVYAGSISGWQSFDLLFDFLKAQLDSNEKIKVLLLTKPIPELLEVQKKYGQKIKQIWSSEQEVSSYLSLADYGLLLRENTLTNKVASPVKFAEYLHAGLSVIISPILHDFKTFVTEKGCGYVFDGNLINLSKTEEASRIKNKNLAIQFLTKSSDAIRTRYLEVLEVCNA